MIAFGLTHKLESQMIYMPTLYMHECIYYEQMNYTLESGIWQERGLSGRDLRRNWTPNCLKWYRAFNWVD